MLLPRLRPRGFLHRDAREPALREHVLDRAGVDYGRDLRPAAGCCRLRDERDLLLPLVLRCAVRVFKKAEL
eukprot:4784432-Heterocapsa_arctica.AAC.1